MDAENNAPFVQSWCSKAAIYENYTPFLQADADKPSFDNNYTPFWKSWEATIWWELYTFLAELMLRSHHLMRIIHLSEKVEKPQFDENYTLFLQGWCSETTIILDLHTFLKELVLKKHYLIRIFHTLRKISTSLWEQMIENLLIRVIITLCYFFYFSPFLLLLTEQANLFDIFYFSCILISNKIFEPAWTNGLKYFRFWWRFRLVFLILVSKNSLPVPAVSYSWE